MAEYFVSTTGSDVTGNGTSTTPWATLAHALANTSSGDSILIGSGSYVFSDIKDTPAIWSGKTVIGAADMTTIFDGGGNTGNTIGWYFLGTVYIHNIHFTNFDSSSNSIDVNVQNVFYGSNAGPIDVYFYNCIFSNFEDYIRPGILFCSVQTNTHLNTISLIGCCMYNARFQFSIDAITSRGQNTTNATSFNAYNCTFDLSDAKNMFGFMRGDHATTRIFNCIIYNTGSIKYFFNYDNATGIVYNSCIYGMTIRNSFTESSNVITSDPLFVDPSNGNFNLRPSSPCIDTGILI